MIVSLIALFPPVHILFCFLSGWEDHQKICLSVVQALQDRIKPSAPPPPAKLAAPAAGSLDPLCMALTTLADLDLTLLEDPTLKLMLDLLLVQGISHITIFCHAEAVLKRKINTNKFVATAKIAERMCSSKSLKNPRKLSSTHKK